MMNEMSSDMQQKNYYAPKKFAVTSEDGATDAAPTDKELDAEEAGLTDDRKGYGDGYVDYESTVSERTGIYIIPLNLILTIFSK